MEAINLRTTFNLILRALEVLNQKANAASLRSASSGSHRNALVLVKLAARSLQKMLDDLKRSVDLEMISEQIHRLARTLNDSFDGIEEAGGKADIRKDVEASYNYPAIITVIKASRDAITSQKSEWFSTITASVECCNQLAVAMADACNELLPVLPQIDDEDTHVETNAPCDDSFHLLADRLFNAISCRCDPISPQEIRLRLDKYKTKADNVEDRTLDVLLLCGFQAESFWHSMRLHTREICENPNEQYISKPSSCGRGSASTVVSCVEPDKEIEPWRQVNAPQLRCLCGSIHELDSYWKTYVRHLEVDNLNQLREHRCLEESDNTPNEELSLTAIFQAISHMEIGRVLLGMQLAYALYFLYDGNWLSGRWREENFSLFKWGNQVPCKPWLKVSLPSPPATNGSVPPSHLRFPQILELGIILLELQIGGTVESLLKRPPTDNLNLRWAMATKIFSKMENHIISDDYRRALEFCLKPTIDQLSTGKATELPKLVRQSIYDNVVVRLERTIAKSRANQEIFEVLDLGEVMRTLPLAAPEKDSRSAPLKRKRSPSQDSRNVRQRADMTCPLRTEDLDEYDAVEKIEEHFALFGDESEPRPDKQRAEVSDNWVKNFLKIVNDRLSMEEGSADHTRIKVAVLDTGIDLKHSDFAGEYKTGRIKSIRSWVNGADGVEDTQTCDSSGHGTFISSILLALGPYIDLYVARVSESKHFKKGTSENIASALYFARTEWKVDIITMSFGYPRGIESIKTQITQAVQNNILVFAAASNDGSNRSRMFPARQLGVFAIHSTTGHGAISDFNPDPKRDENFSLLGEYIESAWLTTGGSAVTRRLSGTSFATPIAACLTAFMLLYVPIILPGHDKFFHKLKSYEGMRNVLQLMAKEQTAVGRTYQYLSPQCYFEENTLSGIIVSIEKALSM